jgi:hypothetical protein
MSNANYVIEFEIHPKTKERHIIEKRFKIAKQIYNACLGETLKRLRKIRADKEYRTLVQMVKEKSSANNKECKNRIKEIELFYGYSEFQMHDYVSPIQKHFNGQIGSLEAQKLATRAFSSVEKMHYRKAKKVYFKRYDDDMSIENKSNTTGLMLKDTIVKWGKNIEIATINANRNDIYACNSFLDKTKYIRILSKNIRGKVRYFVQLIKGGIPPQKKNRRLGKENEKVGIDIGTSTIAIASEKKVSLKELAPNCEIDAKALKRIDRAMERSKRATNADNYKEDGTIKKGRRQWLYSNNYVKLKEKRREMYRKIADKRKQNHEMLANSILDLGLDIRVETMNFRALQKRSKKTTKNKKNGKINKKKRFGKSLMNYAPSMLIDIIDRKLSYFIKPYRTKGTRRCIKEIDTYKVKASQYNHLEDNYKTKTLNDRWNILNGEEVQRDMYSAFLIMNTKDDLKSVDIDRCNKTYKNFLALEKQEVENIRQSKNKKLRWFVA